MQDAYRVKVSSVEPTTDGNEGRFNIPGEGCVTSAPLRVRYVVKSDQWGAHTYDQGIAKECIQPRVVSDTVDAAKLGIDSDVAVHKVSCESRSQIKQRTSSLCSCRIEE